MTAERLIEQFLEAGRVLRGLLADHFAEFGLSDVRFEVLCRLHRAGQTGVSQHEVASGIGQAESSVSTLIDRMRKDGLVFRFADESDKRRRLLVLSPKGRTVLETMLETHSLRMTELAGSLDEESQVEFSRLLGRLRDRWAGVTFEPVSRSEELPREMPRAA